MQFNRIATKFLVVLLPLFFVSFLALSGISYFTARGSCWRTRERMRNSSAGIPS